MIRKIVVGCLILFSFLLQSTFFQAFSIGSIAPNLLLILTFAFGFIRGKKDGLLIGFFCGLLIDVFYGDVIGFNALVYMYIGYINGLFNKLFYDEDVTLPLALIIGSDLLYNFLFYIFRFLLRNRLDISFYFTKVMLPELIYTVLFTVLVYRLILRLNRVLERFDRRSDGKFV